MNAFCHAMSLNKEDTIQDNKSIANQLVSESIN